MDKPVEYIELNMSNFNDDDVLQLNEWGIWAADELAKQPPSNPHYKIEYQWSMDGGNGIISIPAPGGHIDPIEAADLLEFLELVARHIKRISTDGKGD